MHDSVVRAFPRAQMFLNFTNSQIFSSANFRLLEVTSCLFQVQSKFGWNNFERKDSSLCVTVFDFILLPCLESLSCIHIKRKKGGGGVDQSEVFDQSETVTMSDRDPVCPKVMHRSRITDCGSVFPLCRQVHHERLHRHQHPHLGPERRGTGLYQH